MAHGNKTVEGVPRPHRCWVTRILVICSQSKQTPMIWAMASSSTKKTTQSSISAKKKSALHQHTSTYAKELWAIIESIVKWRHYLLGTTFTIKTNHYSLKNLLNQTIQTPDQQHFLSKFLGYSHTIIYKRGKDNKATNALSRLLAEEELFCSS